MTKILIQLAIRELSALHNYNAGVLGRLACTIVQFRKFIYQSKLKICINAEKVT